MKVILARVKRAVKQSTNQLGNRRCSSANGFLTFKIVGAMTSLILTLALGFVGAGNVSAASINVSIASSISLDLIPSSTGTFASSSTTDTIISVMTDNYTGYTLGIAASNTSDSTLSNGNGGTITSIGSAIDQNTFSTSTDYNNKWGYRPSKYNSTDNTNYLPATTASTSNPDILDETSVANTTANTYNIAIGARVDLTTAPGSYTNSYIITAVANGTPYTITYNANAGGDSTVTNMPSNETNGLSYADTVILSSTIPTRTGYTFAGWCSAAEATSESTCSGTLYNTTNNNLGDYPIDRTASSNNVSVSAMWTVNQYTCTKQYRLQTATAGWGSYTTDTTEQVNYGATCSYTNTMTDYKGSSSASNGASGTATCTMTENGCTASIDFYRNTYALTINRNTTYISSVSGAGTYRWGQSVAISATASSGNEFTSWSQTSGTTGSFGSTSSASTTFTMPKSAATIYADGKSSKLYMWNATSANCGTTMYDNRDGTERSYTTATIGSLCWMTQNLMLGSSSTVALTSATSNVSSSGYTLPARGTYGATTSGRYVWGNDTQCTSSSTTACAGYYSYATATAGTNPSSGASSYDICPANWRLPTSAELTTLKDTYTTGATLTASPFLGVYAGNYSNSSFRNGGSYGYYWSSTASDTSRAYRLLFNSSSAGVTYDYKSLGYSIRCVAKS